MIAKPYRATKTSSLSEKSKVEVAGLAFVLLSVLGTIPFDVVYDRYKTRKLINRSVAQTQRDRGISNSGV